MYEYQLSKKNISQSFNKLFFDSLNSEQNFTNFLNETKKINDISGIKKIEFITPENEEAQNLDTKSFSKERYLEISSLKINLFFNKSLIGNTILDQYVNNTLDQTKKIFKNQIKLTIINTIKVQKKNLEIAKGINLQNPIIQFLYEDKDSAIINEPSELFYKGVKVLNRKIIELK